MVVVLVLNELNVVVVAVVVAPEAQAGNEFMGFGDRLPRFDKAITLHEVE